MTKLIQNEADKLYDNIFKYSNHETAKKIAYGVDIGSRSSGSEKEDWVKHVSSELEKCFDEQTIKKIRMGCYCNENGKLDQSKEFIRNIYKASLSIKDFVDKMNKHGAGWYIEDGKLFTKYFSCPCPMLDKVGELPSKTWCYCTVGYNKQIFEYAFDCEIDVELVESIKTGSNQCLMKVTLPNVDS